MRVPRPAARMTAVAGRDGEDEGEEGMVLMTFCG
ncbi:hypothetical protein GXY_05616 [Novacetimonas hansenii ATCC 23769]|uniref:Uncharacterized protein n=1 Tax=Novacetimonas hansenii ATCC 23769 TaxID=714995 RepID=D5QDB7_NOVHA|nr:hypothetical protein GXY_05616 [Novacetimonas hansenii ATCC 23769]